MLFYIIDANCEGPFCVYLLATGHFVHLALCMKRSQVNKPKR